MRSNRLKLKLAWHQLLCLQQRRRGSYTRSFHLRPHSYHLSRSDPSSSPDNLLRRDDDDGFDSHKIKDVIFAALIPILVLLSGLFAGLTLGYMSLDQTQLNVLSISGTP